MKISAFEKELAELAIQADKDTEAEESKANAGLSKQGSDVDSTKADAGLSK